MQSDPDSKEPEGSSCCLLMPNLFADDFLVLSLHTATLALGCQSASQGTIPPPSEGAPIIMQHARKSACVKQAYISVNFPFFLEVIITSE